MPLTVPKSEVSLAISPDSLHSLPPGASYSGRNGQASVKVMLKAATATEPEKIYVYATCDSLQLQCESYERTIRNLRAVYSEEIAALEAQIASSNTSSATTHKTRKDALGMLLKRLFACIVTALVFIGIIYYIINKEKKHE